MVCGDCLTDTFLIFLKAEVRVARWWVKTLVSCVDLTLLTNDYISSTSTSRIDNHY